MDLSAQSALPCSQRSRLASGVEGADALQGLREPHLALRDAEGVSALDLGPLLGGSLGALPLGHAAAPRFACLGRDAGAGLRLADAGPEPVRLDRVGVP